MVLDNRIPDAKTQAAVLKVYMKVKAGAVSYTHLSKIARSIESKGAESHEHGHIFYHKNQHERVYQR